MRGSICILIFVLCGALPTGLAAQQRILQLEKYGSAKTIQFFEGDELFVRLIDDGQGWKRVVIDEISASGELIRFDIGTVRLDEIEAIKTVSQSEVANFVKTKLIFFGGGLLLLSPLDLLVDLPYNTALGLYVGGGAIAAGFLFKEILDLVLVHRLGKRKWLRVIVLPFDAIPRPSRR